MIGDTEIGGLAGDFWATRYSAWSDFRRSGLASR